MFEPLPINRQQQPAQPAPQTLGDRDRASAAQSGPTPAQVQDAKQDGKP